MTVDLSGPPVCIADLCLARTADMQLRCCCVVCWPGTVWSRDSAGRDLLLATIAAEVTRDTVGADAHDLARLSRLREAAGRQLGLSDAESQLPVLAELLGSGLSFEDALCVIDRMGELGQSEGNS